LWEIASVQIITGLEIDIKHDVAAKLN